MTLAVRTLPQNNSHLFPILNILRFFNIRIYTTMTAGRLLPVRSSGLVQRGLVTHAFGNPRGQV